MEKSDKIFWIGYVCFLVGMLIGVSVFMFSSEVYDYIDTSKVLENVGSSICWNHGESFVDWEDNQLICSSTIIDFNKPVR